MGGGRNAIQTGNQKRVWYHAARRCCVRVRVDAWGGRRLRVLRAACKRNATKRERSRGGTNERRLAGVGQRARRDSIRGLLCAGDVRSLCDFCVRGRSARCSAPIGWQNGCEIEAGARDVGRESRMGLRQGSRYTQLRLQRGGRMSRVAWHRQGRTRTLRIFTIQRKQIVELVINAARRSSGWRWLKRCVAF